MSHEPNGGQKYNIKACKEQQQWQGSNIWDNYGKSKLHLWRISEQNEDGDCWVHLGPESFVFSFGIQRHMV
jgi:hypothetical protein